MDDSGPLVTRCYEVANKLADEYPEYTLTAIRVMTAEKLGVTRQYVENLDIKPVRFKSMRYFRWLAYYSGLRLNYCTGLS